MISFIILHYKNIEDTLNCLEKLKTLISNQNASMVVVDNHSLSKKEEEKILHYTKDLLLLDKNYGFAQANNKGIQYAKKKYHPEFYCVINNDVIITQPDFINQINNLYQTYHFDMLGPQIESPSGESVNPFPVLKNKEEIELEKKKCEKLIKIYQSTFWTSLLFLYIKGKKIIKKPKKLKNGRQMQKNVALHGCAIIFSKKYIEKYADAFDKGTFLFHEEEFLYQRMKKDHLISVYSPKIKVYHKEGSSLKNTFKKERESKLFKEKERLKSLNLLLKEMK